jgi:tRNA-2-methylthio-N6-dimethylallyladenosine synthase
VIDTDFPAESKFDHLPHAAAPQSEGGVTAFLSIQEGCDKFCSFCVVPYTRGAEASRPAASVLAEARRMVAAGAREITLLGQNVNAYHGEGPDGGAWSLARLLRELADIPGVAALHHQPSARHGRRPDRGAWRIAGADAVPAFAGAERIGPHAVGDEPAAYGR